jgi:hypothetical protein
LVRQFPKMFGAKGPDACRAVLLEPFLCNFVI